MRLRGRTLRARAICSSVHRLARPSILCSRHLSTALRPSSTGLFITDPYNAHSLLASLKLGSFSEADMNDAFDRLDKNMDDRLSIDEVRTAFQGYAARKGLSDADLGAMTERFMELWDDDKSKTIERDEFNRHATALGKELHPAAYQLCGGIALTALPFGILVPFEPQLVAHLGITAAGFGAANGALFFSNVLCTIPMTEVVARRGSKQILVGSLVLMGASMGAVALVHSLEQLVACRLAGGVALSGIVAANMAGVVKIGTPLNRTKNMALLMQARNTGMALGPAVGGLLGSLVSMQAAFAGVGLGLAGSALVFGRIYRDVAPGDQKPIDPPLQLFRTAFVSWREVLTTVPDLGALCVMSAVANGSLAGTNMTLLPLLLCDELGLGTGAIGSMLAANAVVGAVTGGQMGALAHRVGPRLAIGAGATTVAVGMAAQPALGDATLILGALCSAQLGLGVLTPTLAAQIQEKVLKEKPSLVMQAMSLQNTSSFIGLVAGAGVGGAVGSQLGFAAGYQTVSMGLLVAGLATAARFPVRKLS